MVILISGATHTGKTRLAQELLEKIKFSYLSLDHLKMGLIRSGQTKIKVDEDEKLTPYLFSIASEMIKTAIENEQNLVVEGCYIPFDFEKYFTKEYLDEICYVCLIMSKEYIENNFDTILECESVVEKRMWVGDITKQDLIRENEFNLACCKKFNLPYYLIDKEYDVCFEKLPDLKLPF